MGNDIKMAITREGQKFRKYLQIGNVVNRNHKISIITDIYCSHFVDICDVIYIDGKIEEGQCVEQYKFIANNLEEYKNEFVNENMDLFEYPEKFMKIMKRFGK